jgi:hypothetical protein
MTRGGRGCCCCWRQTIPGPPFATNWTCHDAFISRWSKRFREERLAGLFSRHAVSCRPFRNSSSICSYVGIIQPMKSAWQCTFASPTNVKSHKFPILRNALSSTFSTILSTIRFASATASAIAATCSGLFLGAVANFRAASIDAQMAITADFRGSSTAER